MRTDKFRKKDGSVNVNRERSAPYMPHTFWKRNKNKVSATRWVVLLQIWHRVCRFSERTKEKKRKRERSSSVSVTLVTHCVLFRWRAGNIKLSEKFGRSSREDFYVNILLNTSELSNVLNENCFQPSGDAQPWYFISRNYYSFSAIHLCLPTWVPVPVDKVVPVL